MPTIEDVEVYARQGWKVVQLFGVTDGRCDCGRPDCYPPTADKPASGSPGKHPTSLHGLLDATTDMDVLRRQWIRHPNANLGICTGLPTGLIVLDEDGAVGRENLAELQRQCGSLPATMQSRTGRPDGGVHRWYAITPDHAWVRNSSGRLAEKLDIRAAGGYVVVPPSLHISGNKYQWELPIVPPAPLAGTWLEDRLRVLSAGAHTGSVVAAPAQDPCSVFKPHTVSGMLAWLAEESPHSTLGRVRAYLRNVDMIRGERNNAIYRLTGNVMAFVDHDKKRLPDAKIHEVMAQFNASNVLPPLSSAELRTAVGSALRGTGTPRKLKPPPPTAEMKIAASLSIIPHRSFSRPMTSCNR